MTTIIRRRFASLILLLSFSLVSFSALSAQTSTASLKVIVTDPSGGAVGNAELTLSSTTQGIPHRGTSNSAGQYTFTFLDPGQYKLEVRAVGFTGFIENRVMLEVGQVADMDVTMKVGSVSESVEVQAPVVQLDTASGALASVVDRKAMDDLPLNGRNNYQLAQLNSSVNTTPSSRSPLPSLPASTAFSMGGGRSQTNEVLLDGSPITGRADNYPNVAQSTDAVQEFRIQTNSYAAEYGRAAGGTLNLVTRAGGNRYHGTLWDFFRNDDLDANNFFSNRTGAGKGEVRYNQFGGNAGGPIKKDKLFFFANFEMLRSVSGLLTQSTVPTAAEKAGNFSVLPGAIYSVAANGVRTALPGNVIPTALINPVGKALASYLPDPNRPGLLNNYVIFNPIDVTNRQIVVRTDYQLTNNQRLFFRITRDWDTSTTGGNFPGSPATTTSDGTSILHPLATTLDYVNTLTSRSILHLNGSFSRSTQLRTQPAKGFDPTTLGFPSVVETGSGEGKIFPTIGITGYTTEGPLKNFGETDTYQNNYSWVGDMTILRGSHAIKFGANFRDYQLNNFRADDPAGNFTFTRAFSAKTSADTTTGDAFASMLLGLPSAGDIGISPKLAAANSYFSGFVQDDWTISPKLTVNLGLRWEADLPTTERFNRLTNFATQAPFPVTLSATFPVALGVPNYSRALTGAIQFVGQNGTTRYLSDPDLNNFAPRLGVAYKLTPKTVIRAGAGIFYGTMNGGGISAASLGMLTSSLETTYVASLDNGVTPLAGASLSNPFPSGITPAPGTSQGALTAYGNANVQSKLRDLRDPYTAQWNLNIQRELPGKMVAEISYAGSSGVGLLGGNDDLNQISPAVRALGPTVLNTLVANPFVALPVAQQPPASSAIGRATVSVAQLLRPYPQFGIVTALFQNTAHSTYHSMTARVERRFSSDLAFRASYTFSKSLDDISAISVNNGTQVTDSQDANNRRLDKSLSAFDARNRFVGTMNYALPFGVGKRYLNHKGFADYLIGGWAINMIATAQGGFPLSVTATPPAGQLGLSSRTLRPNLVGNPQGTGTTEDQQINAWFNTAAFSQPASFAIGTAPRFLNDRGPGYLSTDFSIHKNFVIHEDIHFQLRMEAFNIINRVNLSIPATVFGSAGFGVISSAEAARQVQIAAKFYF